MELAEPTAQWLLELTGSPVARAVEYPRAHTATVHRVTLASGVDLVVKRYDVDDPYDRRPDRAAHEAAVLEILASSAIPAPKLVAVDGDGSASGAPTVLMEHVDGTGDLEGARLERLTDLIAALHLVDPGPVEWEYRRYASGYRLFPPGWASDGGLWCAAFEVAAAPPPVTIRGFVHRDLHAGNIIWRGGEVAAVIDWMSACIGPVALDLSHCRANLAMDMGIETARRFLGSYLRRVLGGTWHPHWDVVDAIDFLPYWAGEVAVDGWHWDARPPQVTRALLEEYLKGALDAMEKIG